MLNRFLKQGWFPITLQVVMLGIFIEIIRYSWNIYSRDSNSILFLRYSNIANLVVWNYWWPAVIFGAILIGRVWCTVCPMELIQNIMSRIGFKLKPPRWLRSGWLITILFGIILVLGMHTWSIRQVPHQMAIYMTTLLGLTLAFSILFEKRTFCSYICPVGHLLGLCSTASCTEWRVKDRSVCTACSEKSCVNSNRQNAWYGRSCQSNLFPGALNDNRDCILCTQCIKACPNNNVAFRFRKPFADLFKDIKLNNAQTAFMILILGHAFLGIVGEWNRSSTWIHVPFNNLNAALSIPRPWDGAVNGIWFLMIIPAVLLLAGTALSSWMDERKLSVSKFSLNLAGFIPIVASSFFAKSIFTPLSRLQNLPTALKDPFGWDTAHKMAVGLMEVGGPWQLMLNDAARYFSSLILLGGFGVTVLLLTRMPRKNKMSAVPLIAIALLYVSITFGTMVGSALEPNEIFVEPYNPCGATITIPSR